MPFHSENIGRGGPALPPLPYPAALLPDEPFPATRRTLGHLCKRPFTNTLLICKNALQRDATPIVLPKHRNAAICMSSPAVPCPTPPPGSCARSWPRALRQGQRAARDHRGAGVPADPGPAARPMRKRDPLHAFLSTRPAPICYRRVRRRPMDSPHDRQTGHAMPAMPSEAELRAAMEQSDRDVAAGLTVPLADVLTELDGVANRIEARRRLRQA